MSEIGRGGKTESYLLFSLPVYFDLITPFCFNDPPLATLALSLILFRSSFLFSTFFELLSIFFFLFALSSFLFSFFALLSLLLLH